MKAADDFELAKRFREILEIPERVNDMNIVETKEMLLYCFKRHDKLITTDYWDNISVMDNLLIYYNQNFQETKLPKEITTSYYYNLGMELLLLNRQKPGQIACEFEKMLSDFSKDYELVDDCHVLKEMIKFFYDLEEETNIKPRALHQGSTPAPMTFADHILHPDRERIAEALKTSFRNKKGKSIRLMIEVLADQLLITYENRQRKKLYNAMKPYFNWDIGTYQSIFNYKQNDDLTDYKAVETSVLFILKTIENNK